MEVDGDTPSASYIARIFFYPFKYFEYVTVQRTEATAVDIKDRARLMGSARRPGSGILDVDNNGGETIVGQGRRTTTVVKSL